MACGVLLYPELQNAECRMSPSRPFLSSAMFAGLPGIDPRIVAALQGAFEGKPITAMTVPQAKYVPAVMAGGDAIVRAATGTGKTIGFLVPAVQRVLNTCAGAPLPDGVSVLVLSPTRGLAEQTAKEARSLVSGFQGAIGVQVVIGGTPKALPDGRCDILSATPGRLVDLIESAGGFAARLRSVCVLVLDEADVMLDSGFLVAIRRIVAALRGPETRQTMLFSATLSRDVLALARPPLMRDGVQPINATGGTARASRSRVTHVVRMVEVGRLLPEAVRAILAHVRAKPAHRVILFANTVSTVHFYAALLRATGDPDLSGTLELHSDMTQNQRRSAHAAFAARGGVLVASDVIGRGVDFPDVSLVVQIGVAQDLDQVVHRVGRTGRAGRPGEAVTLLGTDEASGELLSAMQAKIPATTVVPAGSRRPTSYSAVLGRAAQAVHARDNGKAACDAYRGSLGFYNGQRKRLRWTAAQLIEAVRQRFEPLGAVGCVVTERQLKKMNLQHAYAAS